MYPHCGSHSLFQHMLPMVVPKLWPSYLLAIGLLWPANPIWSCWKLSWPTAVTFQVCCFPLVVEPSHNNRSHRAGSDFALTVPSDAHCPLLDHTIVFWTYRPSDFLGSAGFPQRPSWLLHLSGLDGYAPTFFRQYPRPLFQKAPEVRRGPLWFSFGWSAFFTYHWQIETLPKVQRERELASSVGQCSAKLKVFLKTRLFTIFWNIHFCQNSVLLIRLQCSLVDSTPTLIYGYVEVFSYFPGQLNPSAVYMYLFCIYSWK